MDLNLSGKVPLVTGGSRGIGREIASNLHEEGCHVAIAARTAAKLDDLGSQLRTRVSTHAVDVTVPDDCRRLMEEVKARWNGIDLLVCAVGSGTSVPPGEETPGEWERVFATNLWSVTNVVAAATPVLRAGGAIVAISSICGLAALGAPVTYSAAKASLNAYVRGVARPLAAAGIRINALAPGNILTEGGVWERRLEGSPAVVRDMLERDVALKRLGTPQEIADCACFLLSGRASFVTGTIVVADGGQLRA
jgi:3-oxoacyl-[acyl-carrier protein] reductase